MAAEALFTIKRVELIDKKEFAKEALDENVEAFVMHVISISFSLLKRLDENVEAFVVHVTSLCLSWMRTLKPLWCT